VTVALDGSFRKIRGTQDPDVNDGRTVTSVAIPARDGLILLRIPTVDLSASRTILTCGLETTLQVTIAPAPAGEVRIQKRAVGSALWATIDTVVTDADGLMRFGYSPVVTTEYRALAIKSGVASRAVKVAVRPGVTIRASRSTALTHSAVTLSGSVRPSGHSHLALQRLTHGRWITVRHLSTSSTGRYSTRVSMSARGTFAYRVYVAADASHIAGTSQVVKVTFR
jgi:5-hydroxyisourate hydrolase-like protein (transthyretin family)